MKDFLDKSAKILNIQQHQLNSTTNKIDEVKCLMSKIEKEQNNNNEVLDELLDNMESLLNNEKFVISEEEIEQEIVLINNELNNVEVDYSRKISEVDFIQIDDNISWDEYNKLVDDYMKKHNIKVSDDPFKDLMPLSQQKEIYKRIKEEFTYKSAKCDKYDYLIAGTCGVIGGLIDILFVGIAGDSKLGNIVDEQANKITEKFAEFLGWNKNKSLERGSNTTASAIAFLENKFRINYDQATTYDTNGLVKNLTLKNHHLKSLGHSPDLIGLFFSILNQFTSTSTFIDNGKIITINTETFELQGGNFIAKVFCGFANWFGHIMSDWTGSSGTVGQGRRGTGVPIPFYNLFQLMDFGHFGKKERQTFAMITSEVFEKGYDFRYGISLAVPVLITELLIKFMFTMKRRFYHKKDWSECIPNASIPELRRMLLVGHGILCLMDGADAYLKSGGELVTFLSRTNLIGWVRFGNLALKELTAWYHEGHLDLEKIDNYLEKEYIRLYKELYF